MAKAKLTDEEIAGIVAKAISNSETYNDSTLAAERTLVDRYYRGEEPKPMHKGDSKYVSRDVFDSVDTARATVLEAFSASNRIVTFRPERGESAADAKQATEYARHTFFKRNPGDDILYGALTDGLKARIAVAKVYYKEHTTTTDYDFKNLTPEELTMQVQKFDNYTFTKTAIDPDTGLYSGTYQVEDSEKGIKVDLVQPEDFLISGGASSVFTAKFVAHRVSHTKSWFVEKYGESVTDDMNFSESDSGLFDWEKQQRLEQLGIDPNLDSFDEENQEAVLYECYIRLDIDGDGKTELWKVDYASNVVLDKERVSFAPFATFVPMPIPHTFIGENFAKSVIPIQNARTVLVRQIINHALITNNPRQQVLTGTLANPAELLDNRLGGIVNVRRLDGIAPIPQAALNPYIFSLIQMIDSDKEEVTGVSKLSQGLNKDAISTQNSQGMVEQLISASQQRTKTIARRFGIFVRDLFFLIYNTAADYIDEDTFVDVTGSYAPVHPSSWQHRTVASVELTLGYGEMEAQAQKLMQIDAQYSQDPGLQGLYSPQNRYEMQRRILEKRGIEDIENILTPPDKVPPQQPDPAQELKMQNLQLQNQYLQAQIAAMNAKPQNDQFANATDRARVSNDMQIKQINAGINRLRTQHEIELDNAEFAAAQTMPDARAIIDPR